MKAVKRSTSKKSIENSLDVISRSLDINIIKDVEQDNSILETQHLLSTIMNRKRLSESIEQMENGKPEIYSVEKL